MTHEEIAGLCAQLNYRDKLRLAQQLIQDAMTEDATRTPGPQTQNTQNDSPYHRNNPEVLQYVFERLTNIRPSKKSSLQNSIGAMFQYRGGISDAENEAIIVELQRLKHIEIDACNRVTYL